MTLMMNSISKYTFNYIDAARIIGIFFVVYGHEHPFMETNDLLLRKYIYSFHMPLFFLISGMLSYGGANLSFKQRERKLWYSLIVPYFLYHSYLILKLFISPNIFWQDVVHILTVNMTPNSPCWFFVALFVIRSVCECFNKKYVLLIIATSIYILCSCAGILLGSFLCSHAIISGCIFYTVGQIGIKHIEAMNKKNMLGLAFISILLVGLYMLYFPRYDMYVGSYNNPLLYILVSVASSFLILFFSWMITQKIPVHLLDKIKPLSRGTMLIVGSHYPIVSLLSKKYFCNHDSLMVKLLITFILIVGYWFIIKMTYKRFPILYGKCNLLKKLND